MTNNNTRPARPAERRPMSEYYGHERATRGFLTFEQVFPGSLFFIRQEVSRGHKYPSRDRTLYRKADDGFYAEAVDGGKGLVLMPEDLCVPVRK
jgi:hypothetical protein